MDTLNYGEPFIIEDACSMVDEFMEIYERRPIVNNQGGMLSAHIFWTWYMCKKLKPNYIIESGVYKGQGTWIMREACPDANIYCIDPDLSQRVFIDDKATYFTKDFSLINWDEIINIENREEVLCFFDDHQNEYLRLMEMKWMGFKKAMFEDNYPIKQGDCYSIKKVLSETGFNEDVKRQEDRIQANVAHAVYFKKNVRSYVTLPPLVKTKYTRWGDMWEDDYYLTGIPILNEEKKKQYPVFVKEANSYNWICFVELG